MAAETNYHKHRDLNNTFYYFTFWQNVNAEVQCMFHWANIKVLAGLCSHLDALKRIHSSSFPASRDYLHSLAPGFQLPPSKTAMWPLSYHSFAVTSPFDSDFSWKIFSPFKNS